MTELLNYCTKMAAFCLPFLLFLLLNGKINLKKPHRSRQFFMPFVALIFGVVAVFYTEWVSLWLIDLLGLAPGWLNRLAWSISVAFVREFFTGLADAIERFLMDQDLKFWICLLGNGVIMLGFVILKLLVLPIGQLIFPKDSAVHRLAAAWFYERDAEGRWYIQPHCAQGRSLLKTLYVGAVVVAMAALMVSGLMYRENMLLVPFYPVFAAILLAELYFFLSGATKDELEDSVGGEADEAGKVYNFSLLRQVLRKLFPDKLLSENTGATSNPSEGLSNEELLHQLEHCGDDVLEDYGLCMRRYLDRTKTLDKNYLLSGQDLLMGRSVLVNDPFYYDLIPYAFYPMNRVLLQHKKVLIVLGRNGTCDDAAAWCETGLYTVTHVPELWRIGKLSEEPQELDVGILSPDQVHDRALQEANQAFLEQVDFVFLIEPSRLIPTAQIGLNALVRRCRQGGNTPVFCSTDKNCDGLVDALSHVLMVSITEVSATTRHEGVCSYMCWDADSEPLQHRMLPGVSRYLGTGTELSFAALKYQVPQTAWFGGDRFPVTDMHWIVKQYYGELSQYASLPLTQKTIDTYFKTTPNLWDARVSKTGFMTVEDEANNMFEVKRTFSTRAKEQSFINILSQEYLLKDYMAGNNRIFDADPKAIPYIVADYARTRRNVVLRLCLQMSIQPVPESLVRQELMLIDCNPDNLREALWGLICTVRQSGLEPGTDREGKPTLRLTVGSRVKVFDCQTLVCKRKFSMATSQMETLYALTDPYFNNALLGDLQNARYIAEDDHGDTQYLLTQLRGHIFQKYLPGQKLTLQGKYYEMLSVTENGRVLLRRAADHIDGRPAYRQERHYTLRNVENSTAMGDCRQIGELKLTWQYADITVATPAYYRLDKGNDLETGKRVTVNGIPERLYCNKRLLRIDLPGDAGADVTRTIAQLMNEVFATLFAENAPYIAAVVPEEAQLPATYSLEVANAEHTGCSIYILEDSQLDLGLLVAVERNLNRIFHIISDYLQWHTQELEVSLNPPPEPKTPEYVLPPEEQGKKRKKKGFFGKIWEAIKNFFKKIAEFFKKLFGIKPKTPKAPEAPTEPEAPQTPDIPEVTAEPVEPEAVPAEPADQPDAPDEGGEGEESFQNMCLFSAEDDTVEFEPEQVVQPGPDLPVRKPYHQRYFLLYGGKAVPESLELAGTLAFLLEQGYDGGFLRRAREGKDIADALERNFVPNKPGTHYCDFCAAELVGTAYEVLSDGRERCLSCGRTAVKTAEEFKELHRIVSRNLEAFYGIRITKPVYVRMVNAQKLHRHLGHTFVPTGQKDGRILGVAIHDRDGYSILVENGSPRLKSMMTMAHEMTHIWQYLNWDRKKIQRMYGELEPEVYEGMAKWVEIQYAYLIGETEAAKREEIVSRLREDEYGRGFRKYVSKYPLSIGTHLEGKTPFDSPDKPL